MLLPAPRPGKILRSGQPRHSDGPDGPAHRRQTPVEDHPLLSRSGDDAGRRLHRATRRLSPKGAHCPRCLPTFCWTRQGAGTAGSPLLPLCRRLQRQRAVGSRGRTGHGLAHGLPGKQARLKVNHAKSAVAPTKERSFLGHRLPPGGRLGIAPKSLKRAKDKLRETTRRNRASRSSR